MSDRDLTVLCVSRHDGYATPFLARLAQDAAMIDADLRIEHDGASIQSAGYVESVLDEAVDRCDTGYVLRVDDDEQLSVQMLEWLRRREYRQSPHWAFPRRNLWPDAQHYIANDPLWPDLQTRLSTKALSGGRGGVHDGSPFGTGRVAQVPLDHHKFLVRSREDRERLVRRYDEVRAGAGSEYVMFSVPELYRDELRLEAIT